MTAVAERIEPPARSTLALSKTQVNLVFATVLVGKLGDNFGRKALFQASVAIFIIGSFLCGRIPIVHVYSESIHYVFLFAVPVALVAFVLALLLPQVKMRGTAQETVKWPGEDFAKPESSDASVQLEDHQDRVPA